MLLGAKSAPNYFTLQEDNKDIFRRLKYHKSKERLLKVLKKQNPNTIKALLQNFENLSHVMEKSPLAFIGSSVLILVGSEDKIKVLLIDPAHMQVDPKLRNQSLPSINAKEKNNIYYGSESDFKNRKKSNKIALTAIITTIKKFTQ